MPSSVWLERVCSFSNPGDMPSRKQTKEAAQLFKASECGVLRVPTPLTDAILTLHRETYASQTQQSKRALTVRSPVCCLVTFYVFGMFSYFGIFFYLKSWEHVLNEPPTLCIIPMRVCTYVMYIMHDTYRFSVRFLEVNWYFPPKKWLPESKKENKTPRKI